MFDNLVAVNHALQKGSYEQCHACRLPITAADTRSPLFEKGVSCPRCHGTHAPDDIRNLRERQRQVELAAARGEQHLGEEARHAIVQRKAQKLAHKRSQQDLHEARDSAEE